MQYRKFGKLDWNTSILGFGAMRLPSKKILFFRKVDVPEAIKTIRYGIDHGINYVDTAWGYHAGKSEIYVGKALQDGYREKVKLVTKCPIWTIKKPEDFDVRLKKQLEKLQTDHLDLYLIHALSKSRFNTVKELNLTKKMEEAKASGLIKAIGFSFHDTWPVFKDIVDYYPWDAVQIQYNYMDTEIQATTKGLEYAASKGMAVIIMEPLKGGRLANPPSEIQSMMKDAKTTRSSVDLALQFVWNRPEVSVVLSGMSSLQQVQENIGSAENAGPSKLKADELQLIGKMGDYYKKMVVVPCTGCDYCQPCPYGVKIPRNFGIINDYSLSNNYNKAKKDYMRLMKENGTAEFCKKCNACLEKCPQQIQIPTMLDKIDKVFKENKAIKDVF